MVIKFDIFQLFRLLIPGGFFAFYDKYTKKYCKNGNIVVFYRTHGYTRIFKQSVRLIRKFDTPVRLKED